MVLGFRIGMWMMSMPLFFHIQFEGMTTSPAIMETFMITCE